MLVPVAVCGGTINRPFFEGNSRAVVVVVSDLVKGSTILLFTPGLWQTPVNVDVTARDTVALVFPTPTICVPVQVTVRPLSVQTGSLEPFA